MKNYLFYLFTILLCVSCEYITELDDISTSEVVALAPNNNVVLDTLLVTFTWQELEGSENYRLQIARPSFNNAKQIVVDTLVSSTNFEQKLPTADDYQWRIKALNSGYSTSYVTKTFSVEK